MSRTSPASTYRHANAVWLDQLGNILSAGEVVRPRGLETRELIHSTVHVDMRQPVITVPERKLNYRFMAAEAFWILAGLDSVDQIAPWNKNIAAFSDDGKTFAGAYGPRISEQLDYVVAKLFEDRDTRQAGLTIWRPNPAPSRDIPCTVAIWFQIREPVLHSSVFMRSSDAWLGLPYDIFNFSMLAHLVAARLNADERRDYDILPGTLSLTMASSHLYATNYDEAAKVINAALVHGSHDNGARTPYKFSTDQHELMEWLKKLRDTKPGDALRWWEGNAS